MSRSRKTKGQYCQFINLAHYPSLHRSWGYVQEVYPDGYSFQFLDGTTMFVRKSELR